MAAKFHTRRFQFDASIAGQSIPSPHSPSPVLHLLTQEDLLCPGLVLPYQLTKLATPINPYSLRQIPLPILYPASRMIPFHSRIVRTGFTFLSEKACQQLDRFRQQQPVRIHRETLTESTCFREWNSCNACSQHPRYPAPVQLLKEEVIRCHVVILLFSLYRPIPLPSLYHEFLSQFGSVSQLAALSPPDVLFFQVEPLTLHETRQYLTTSLQQRMPHHNLQESL